MKNLVFVLTLVIVCFPLCTKAEELGAWSDKVDGIQGRLIANRVSDFYGTRIIDIYLELRNPGAGAIEIYFDDYTLTSRLIDSTEGLKLLPFQADMSVMAPPPYWLIMPNDSVLRFKVSVNGYGIPKGSGTAIQLMEGLILVGSDQKQDFFFESTMTSKPKTKNFLSRPWQGSIKLPKVLIPQ